MSRHRASHSPLRIAGWIYVLIAVVVIAFIAVWLWAGARDRQQASDTTFKNSCPAGEMDFPIAEWKDGAADEVQGAIESMGPVRDYCLNPVFTDDVNKAAILVAPAATADGREMLKGVVVGTAPVYLTAENTDLPATDVIYPVASHPEVSTAAAQALAHSPAEAERVLTRDRFITAEMAQATGKTSISMDTGTKLPGSELPVAAWALAAVDSSPEAEELQRVAQVLIDDLSAEYPAADKDAFTLPAGNPAQPTLFLVDTSEAVAGWLPGIAEGLDKAATGLQHRSQPVAVWNYSSPLNPGVTQPWRVNANFGNPDAGEIAARWGLGGVPMTRTAVVAAIDAAAEFSHSVGQPVRVVLVTTGSTPEEVSDAEFAARLGQAHGAGEVTLDVIHVGGGEIDAVIAEQASSLTPVMENSATPETIARVSGVFGE